MKFAAAKVIHCLVSLLHYFSHHPNRKESVINNCCYLLALAMSTKKKHPSDVVIVSALRTPLCRSKKGGLAQVPPSTLLTTVFQATLSKGRVRGEEIQDICIGNCLMPPSGFAAMRMAQIVAGIPPSVPIQWVNRQCSSGLQAVAHIANAIATGQIEIGIGGGVESMSFYPMYVRMNRMLLVFICECGCC